MIARLGRSAAAGALMLTAVACGGGGNAPSGTPAPTGTPAGSAIVAATDKLTFDPRVVNLAVGGTVTWKNEESVPHTVTFGKFDKPLKPGQTVTFTFTSAGTTTVVCTLHPTMRGTIVVA